MNKEESIQLLKQYLTDVPRLKALHYDNQDFRLWKSKITDVIKAGLEQEDLDTFTSARREDNTIYVTQPRVTGLPYGKFYQDDVTAKETAVKSVIQKYEIIGIEEKSEKAENKDTARLPIQLFDAMHFHPKVIEFSEALFKDGHYALAIFEAFKAVEEVVRQKSGISDLYGKNLMAQVFNEEHPQIRVLESGLFDKDVQEGFKFMFMGASQGIRNPKAHHRIIQNDPYITLEYLGFASLLLKRIDGWNINQKKDGVSESQRQ